MEDAAVTIPDGGWGWVIVSCSFLIHLFVVGTMYSLSVLYVSWLEYFGDGKGVTSWIVSIAVAIMFGMGPLPGAMTRKFGDRAVVMIGGLGMCVGFLTSFFANSVYFLVVSVGIIAGLGAACCYLPSVSLVAMYFTNKRSAAMGISASGLGVGTFFMAPFLNWLVEYYGWRGTMLILAGISLNMSVLGALMMPLEKAPKLKSCGKICKKTSKILTENADFESILQKGGAQIGNYNKNTRSSTEVHGDSSETCEDADARRQSNVYELTIECVCSEHNQTYASVYINATGETNFRGSSNDDRLCAQISRENTHVTSTGKNRNNKPLGCKCLYHANLEGQNIRPYSDKLYSSNFELRDSRVDSRLEVPVVKPVISLNFMHFMLGGSLSNIAFIEKKDKAGYQYHTSSGHLDLKKENINAKDERISHDTNYYQMNNESDSNQSDYNTSSTNEGTDFQDADRPLSRLTGQTEISCPLLIEKEPVDRKPKNRGVALLIKLLEPFQTYVRLLQNGTFLLYSFSNFLTNLSFFMPVLYMVDRALDEGIPRHQAVILISIYGGGNIVGKLFTGWLADRNLLDRLFYYIATLCLCGLATSLSPLCGPNHVLHSLYAFVFGFTTGAYVTLVSVVTVDLMGLEFVSESYGLILSFMGVATALGTPFAGMVFDWTGSYTMSFVVHGIFLLLSAVLLIPILVSRRRQSADTSHTISTLLLK